MLELACLGLSHLTVVHGFKNGKIYVNTFFFSFQYVGESEKAVRQVFQRAKNSAPCVIFFDEIDALCPQRTGGSDHSGSNRVVTQMLTEMDGIEGREGVYIMGATNRENIIDPAIKRPGRLETILYVGLPKHSDRISILNAITKNRNRPSLAADVDFAAISEASEGYSGADLKALVTKASELAFSEIIQDPKIKARKVTKKHFDEALNSIKPSVQGKEKVRYEKTRQKLTNQNEQVESMEIEVHGEKIVENGDNETAENDQNDQANKSDDFSDYVPTQQVVDENREETELRAAVDKDGKETEINVDSENSVTLNGAGKSHENAGLEKNKEESKSLQNGSMAKTDESEKKSLKPDIKDIKNEKTVENGVKKEEKPAQDKPCQFRFLPKMSVRVKENHKEIGGSFVKVVRQVNNTVVVTMKNKEEYEVLDKDLEPFMPTPGDKAKSLIKTDPEGLFEVLRLDDDDDYVDVVNLEDNEEDAMKIEHLCRVDL